MSADRLREAARVLRERAEACDLWQGDDDHGSWADEYRSDGGNGTDAALIRTMHPGVALALADWLDACGDFMADYPAYRHDGEDYAARVADLIVGSAS